MYASYFGLKQSPFSIAPDPRYLFMSERHREALAHLLYGVNGGGGFVLLTGEIGAGKTTVCRCFLEQIPRRCNVAYIFNPKLTVAELLQTVCEEFHIPVQHRGAGETSLKDHIDALNEYLLRTHAVGQNNVLIIDEAQNLSAEVLEQLRLLTNLETNERKLLQIILIGQPELRQMLARPELEQLAQRVIARFHLDALSPPETAQYIQHRLAVAGLRRGQLFDAAALRRIHQLTRGVPRRINLLCDRALLGAYAEGRGKVDKAIVNHAAAEVFPAADTSRTVRAWGLGVGGTALAGVALAGLVTWLVQRPGHLPAATTTPPVAHAAGDNPSPVSTARPAAPAPTVAPPLATAEHILRQTWSTEDDALRPLAALWQATLGHGDACQAAWRQQLVCYRNSGGLPLVRQLERPVVLVLRGNQGAARYAVLTHLDDQRAQLQLAHATQTISLATLSTLWRGEFITLWRAPESYRSKVTQGQSGPVVDWLGQQLDRIEGRPPAAEGTRYSYNPAMQRRVQDFQLSQGLRPDGVAGATTFMQINRAAGVAEPRLHSPVASARASHVLHP